MGKPEVPVLMRRQFRVVMDIEVTVSDITQETADAHLRTFSNYEEIRDDPLYQQSAERDRRLLVAFIANQRRVRDFLTYLAATHAADFLGADELLDKHVESGYERQLVLDAVDDLGPDDAEFYQGADEDGLLWENSENFANAFEHWTLSAEMFEIPTKDQTLRGDNGDNANSRSP